MIKSLIVSGAVSMAAALASPVLAGPFFNPEFNGANYDNEYLGGTITLDLGYEDGGDGYSWYVQGGPAVVMPNGDDNEFEFAGKFGGSVDVDADGKYSVYGELSGITGDEFGWASKLGAKVKF